MSQTGLSKVQSELLIKKIQRYFQDELDQEIGQFDAQFLMDFFIRELSPALYNQGLRDAQTILHSRLDSITEAIDEIEKPTMPDG